MPGVGWVAKCRKRLKGHGPADTTQKSCLEGDSAAVLVDSPGAGDQLAECPASEDAFIDTHEKTVTDKGQQAIDNGIVAEVQDIRSDKNDIEDDGKDVKDNEVDQVVGESFAAVGLLKIDHKIIAQDVLLGVGVCIIVFHKVIYKKISADFCDFWRLPANNYMMADNNHNELIFLQLIRDNTGILYKICHLYCRNTDDREDLMQEMIYQLWRSGQKFDANYKFSTWMYRIALNVAISFYRKESRSGVRVALGGDLRLMELEDKSPGNEDLEEKIDLLQVFISELGELDKALMILYLEERPYREIAEILGITETNVATKLSRIKGRLKQQFQKANKLFL